MAQSLLLFLGLLLTLWETQSHASRLIHSSSSSSASKSLLATVFCDSCLETKFTSNSLVFSGARVRIKCDDFSEVVITNSTGKFQAELPAHIETSSCSVQFELKPELETCNVSESSRGELLETSKGVYSFVFRPQTSLAFCEQSKDLSLGPPDPPEPSSEPSSVKQPDAYHLGPPEPARPSAVVSKSYRLGPPNPPQPKLHN